MSDLDGVVRLVTGAVPTTEPLEPKGNGCVPSPADSSVVDETAARCRALGINVRPGRKFECILPGHAEHTAKVRHTQKGFWQYHCDRSGVDWGLADVWAAVASKQPVRPLSPVAAARWRDRMDYEAKGPDGEPLRTPLAIPLALPPDCPPHARLLAERMALLVGLRDAVFPFTEPFVFAEDFAVAYTGLSKAKVKDAKGWLRRAGILHRTKAQVAFREPVHFVLDAQKRALSATDPASNAALRGLRREAAA